MARAMSKLDNLAEGKWIDSFDKEMIRAFRGLRKGGGASQVGADPR